MRAVLSCVKGENMEKNDGGPAFPHIDYEVEDQGCGPITKRGAGGMSLRDWFAGMALQGMLANSGNMGTNADCVIAAYHVADMMIKKRTE